MPTGEPLEAHDWTPPAGVSSHGGAPIEQDAVFFTEPPPEIGEVLTASTTLRAHHRPMQPLTRSSLVTAPCFAVWIAWMGGLFPAGNDTPVLVCAVLGAIAAAVVFWVTGFRHRCEFVGRDGFAECRLGGSRHARPVVSTFCFHTATGLRSGETAQYYHGIYTGTKFASKWHDAQGRVIRKIAGTYRKEHGSPPPKNRYWFANSAEHAWNVRLLGTLDEQLQRAGFIEFSIKSKDAVRVAPGFLVFLWKGSTHRIDKDDIKTLRVEAGQFDITHKDARWFSSKGKFRFRVNEMSNAKVFLTAVDALLGDADDADAPGS